MEMDGQSYEELVNNRSSSISNNNNGVGGVGMVDESGYDLSIESEESITPNNNNHHNTNKGRQSIGFMLGRNSLSNWTTIGGTQDDDDEEEEEMEDIGHLNTGRKSNVTGRKSSMETPLMGQLINVSSRRSTHQYSAANARAAGSNRGRARDREGGESNNNGASSLSLGRRRRSTNPLNISHISSSSSSNGFDESMMMQEMSIMRDSWSPIRASLENSFVEDASRRASRSLSPRRGGSRGRRSRSPTTGGSGSRRRLLSGGRSSSPPPPNMRSPLGDISPNRQMRSDDRKSPVKSPNGTFSLKEPSPSVSVQQQQQQQDLTSPPQKKTTVKTVVGGGRKSLSLPTLASTRKSFGFSPAVSKGTSPNPNVMVVAKASNNSSQSLSVDDGGASDEIKTIRSPIPTPNSQRRLVKRFRASVPTANYMEPEELEKEEESVVKNSNTGSGGSGGTTVDLLRRFEKSSSTLGTTQMQKQMEYKNEFVFPESIPVPSTETLLSAHNNATSVGTPSHQYQLTRAGTNLLSLQEVILPSILAETSSVLKQKQSKAQRNVKDGMPDHQGKDVVEVIEACRKLVNRCIGEAMKDAGDSWRKREEGRAKARMERHLAQVEQRKTNEMQAKRHRKEQRALARQERYEVAKKKMMQSHPRNKAIFSELVDLDRELPKLKREERKWLQVKKELESLGDPNNEVMKLDPVVTSSSAAMSEQVENTPLEHTATTMVEDVTMAMNRLNWMLTSISSAMEDSDKLRTEAFTKYNEDHKMIGFTEYEDPKDLFRRVARKSIGGTPARA